ncbi:hypothetical protein ACVJ19_004622 [Bradyrhizobium sp. USDA 376]
MPWSAAFDDPIPLSNGRKLRTLQEAADHIMQLPEDSQHASHWQTAIETLIQAAENGWRLDDVRPHRDAARAERGRIPQIASTIS